MRGVVSKVALAALLACACSAAGCRPATSNTDLTQDPIAVVLMVDGPKPKLAVVDLRTFEIVKRIPLRSVAMSLDGDPVSRTVVTAQAGQPHDHDSACGVIDIPTGRVDYVDTTLKNPDNVSFVDGKAYVIHGLQEGDRLLTSVVDVERRRLIANGRASDRAGDVASVRGIPVVPVSAVAATAEWEAARGGLQTLDANGNSTWLAELPYRSSTVLGELDGRVLVVGSIEQANSDPKWEICSVDAATGQVAKVAPIQGVTKGVFRGCVGDGEIYLCDEDGLDPGNPGKEIIVLDAATFAEKRRLAVPGSPADVDVWGDNLVVSDGKTGELLLYEREGTEPVKRVKIVEKALLAADTIVFAQGERRTAFAEGARLTFPTR